MKVIVKRFPLKNIKISNTWVNDPGLLLMDIQNERDDVKINCCKTSS